MMKTALVCALFLTVCLTAEARYNVNWPTAPTKPYSDVQVGPQTLQVSGINDFLYTYEANVVVISTPITIPPFPTKTGAVAGCSDATIATLTTDAESAKDGYLKLFPTSATTTKTLATNQGDWVANVKPFYANFATDVANAQAALSKITDTDQQSKCGSAIDAAKLIIPTLDSANGKLNSGPHISVTQVPIRACKSAVITVVEKYNGVPTGQQVQVQLDAECNQFTASGGVLASEIQNRTYTSSPSPSGTGNFLAVGGTGKFTPTLTSLFDFNMPWEPLGHKATSALGDMRLGISTGPVLQLSSSQASAFGWFVGASASFLKYIYVTPGVHFGQFADYPLGFTSGQQIPSGFGALTPIKRSTTRFGIAITIRGWDISKSTIGGTDQPAPTVKQ
jgi:hypothetical protein